MNASDIVSFLPLHFCLQKASVATILAAARVMPASNETALLSDLLFFSRSGSEPFPDPTNSCVQNRTSSSALTTVLESGVNASLAVTEWPGKISATPGNASDLVKTQVVV